MKGRYWGLRIRTCKRNDALSSTYQLIGQAEGCNVRELGDQ